MTGRRGRRHKQSLDDLKEKGGYRKLKEEELRSHCVKMPLFKWLWTCLQTDYRMMFTA